MDLESRLARMVDKARKVRPELAGLLPEKVTLAGLSETEKYFLAFCADIVEGQDCSKANALKLVKFAKVVLAKRTDNGRLVKASIGWIVKRNCYSVAVRCLNAIEIASAREEEVGLPVLKEVRRLAEKVGDPALAGLLKEGLENRTEVRVFPALLFNHAVSRSPVLSVWSDLKRSPGKQFALNVVLTLILLAIVIWSHAPSPAFTGVLLASIVHMVYVWAMVLPKSRRDEEEHARDPLYWYSLVEESLRKKPGMGGKELVHLLELFMIALSQMPAKDIEDRKKMARNFRSTLMPKTRSIIGEEEFARLDGTLEDLSN